MKTKLPEVPHTARSQVYRDDAGGFHSFVIVEFSAPSRILALLHEHDGFYTIQAASIGSTEHVASRIRRWNHGLKNGGRQFRSNREHLQEAALEGCDSTLSLRLSSFEFHLVGMVCGSLRITPGQWFLGCAAYNANVAESHLDKILAALPAVC